MFIFGGYAECAIPPNFSDLSKFRDVPDNQEIFHNTETDEAIIIEFLEYQKIDDLESAQFHFEEITKENRSDYFRILDISNHNEEQISPFLRQHSNFVSSCSGEQKMLRNGRVCEVFIKLFVVRVKKVATDIVISVNGPISEKESCADVLNDVVSEFRVRDWDLFKSV
ncbi:hypothetical protein MHBO_002856 [Bonamia ostreae]|uniref:Mog1p/PsbP-like protein n=1 Tax=Bonamia ostreae TaxID=126728 RepID=A0ABV2APC1_9EUKA